MAADIELSVGATQGGWESGWNADYDYVHDLASANYTAESSSTAQNTRGMYVTTFLIKRGLFTIDCSSIPSLVTISSAKLVISAAVWENTRNDVDPYSCSVCIVDATGVGANDAGYGQMESKQTILGSLEIPYTSNWGYQTGTKEITFNAAGRAFLESCAGGEARLGLRIDNDIDDVAPGAPWVQRFSINPPTVDGEARYEYPSSFTRVSSIRRAYRPGYYRMELGLGDLGFDWDVSEVGMKKVPDEVVSDKKDMEAYKEVYTRIAQHQSDFRKELNRARTEIELKNYQPTPEMIEYKKTSVPGIISGLQTMPELLEKPTPTNILATLSPVAIGKTVYEAGKSLISNLFKGLFG